MELSDGSRGARESDFRTLRKQVAAISHLLGDVQRRLFTLESAAADARADLREAREIDEQLSEVIEAMIEDVTAAPHNPPRR